MNTKRLSVLIANGDGDFRRHLSAILNRVLSDIDRGRFLVPIDEKAYLSDARTYLNALFHCDVEIYSADDRTLYDPANKMKFAGPLRPAIYLE